MYLNVKLYSYSNLAFPFYPCTGLKFRKAPNRRIFAVPESDVAGPSIQSKCKRKRVEQLPPELYIEDALVPLTEKVETLVNDMNSIKGQLIQVFKVTKRAKIPPLLKQSINTTFQCNIYNRRIFVQWISMLSLMLILKSSTCRKRNYLVIRKGPLSSTLIFSLHMYP